MDFTPVLSRQYSERIESAALTQSEVDYQARQVLLGLSALDLSDALYDIAEEIKRHVAAGNEQQLGAVVSKAVKGYCERVALRLL